MFAMALDVIVWVFLAVWGGFTAALIGWMAYGAALEAAAAICPRRFPVTAHRIRQRKVRRLQAMHRQLAKDQFNRRMPRQYANASRDTIRMILEGGPDYFARNQIKPHRCRQRHRMTRKGKR